MTVFRVFFEIARNILILFPSHFCFSTYLKFAWVQQYNSTYTVTAWKYSCFLKRSDFYIAIDLSIAIHSLSMYMLTSLFVDEIKPEQNITHILIWVKCLIYPNFHIFIWYSQIHYESSFSNEHLSREFNSFFIINLQTPSCLCYICIHEHISHQ